MIVFHSMGGLGNQMFQYATARRIAHALGVEVVVDTSWHRRRILNTTLRPFELGRFAVDLRELRPSEAFWAFPITNRYLSRLPLPSRWKVRRERGRAFDEAVLRCGPDTFLYGYWQSPLYFQDIRELLVREFQPLDPPAAADARVLEAAASSESVFVHVRRGDYVSLPAAAQHHGTCGLDYYAAALQMVSLHVRDPVFFVFSDDPELTRANLKFDAKVIHVNHNGPAAAHQDLRLMTACRHAVIANSSFSWWGAWLGTSESRIVIAPRKWFVASEVNSDLFPPSWQLI